MIKRLTLQNFRGFKKFQLTFHQSTVLIGPNNAGKSTIIGALRTVDLMLRHARSRNASETYQDGERRVLGYPIPPRRFGLDEESLRFNSLQEETRLKVSFSAGGELHAVWPASEAADFFYLIHPNTSIRTSAQVRATFPAYGVVPPLGPLERMEPLLTEKTVREDVNTRLSTRHFRNQLYLLTREPGESENGFTDFLTFIKPWLPEIALGTPEFLYDADPPRVYVPYFEGTQIRDLAWAGDGVQVFLQFLYHCYRLRESMAIVLDEPDVYLHADLQRRLMRLVEGFEAQYVIATHSTEIATEASPESTIWVDRTRPRGVPASKAPDLDTLVETLGTAFNLRLARALRAKYVVFLEGDDWSILRNLAQRLGLTAFTRESDLAVIPIRGSGNWKRLEGIKWLFDELLNQAVTGFLILDRDYKGDSYIQHVREKIHVAPSLRVHFWQRHEIENYLIVPTALARVSGAPSEYVAAAIDEITAQMGEDVLMGMASAHAEDPTVDVRHMPTVLTGFRHQRDEWWSDSFVRLERCPGKEIISRVNQRLQRDGYKAVNRLHLSRSLNRDEIAPEVVEVLCSAIGKFEEK